MSGGLSDAQKVTAAKTTEIMGQLLSIDSAAGYQPMTDYVLFSFTQDPGFPNIPRKIQGAARKNSKISGRRIIPQQ